MRCAIISCSKTKQSYPCEAYKLYSKSTLFKKLYNYSITNYDNVYIVSAKYGLINPTDIIEPYDLSLYSMNYSDRYNWGFNVAKTITDIINPNDSIHFFCGKIYRTCILQYLDKNMFNIDIPFEHLGIGRQLKVLNEY